MQYVRIDAVEYRVKVRYKSMERSFKIVEGKNAGRAVSSKLIQDLLGTAYGYEFAVEPDPRYPLDYDNFFDAISAPAESHSVALPYGQDILEFEAKITEGSDTYAGKMGGFERWEGLTVRFEPIAPQRRAENG